MSDESSRLDRLLSQNRILSDGEKAEALVKCVSAIFVWPGTGRTKEELIEDTQTGLIIGTTTAVDIMFGYEEGELLGQPIEILIPDRFRDRHRAHFINFALNPTKRLMGAQGMKLYGLKKNLEEFQLEIALEQRLVNRQRTIIALPQHARLV